MGRVHAIVTQRLGSGLVHRAALVQAVTLEQSAKIIVLESTKELLVAVEESARRIPTAMAHVSATSATVQIVVVSLAIWPTTLSPAR